MHFAAVLSLSLPALRLLWPFRADTAVDARAAIPDWVIENFTRVCTPGDAACAVSFTINTQNGAAETPCAYQVNGNSAGRKEVNGITCGAYKVSSAWSGQFGPENGFTTWAVVNEGQRLLVWPAYTDKELAQGPVTPNRSYTPSAF